MGSLCSDFALPWMRPGRRKLRREQLTPLKDEDLQEGQVGLLPCVKHVLWSNVYFGAVPHDHPQLHELTVYLVRQRMYMEMLPRSRFFAAKFSWADFPQPQRQCD